jgi:hypothetical protein
MIWRIYRVPGSKNLWHIDNGPGTQILNVLGFEINAPCKNSRDETAFPREWIELSFKETELHVIGGIAQWQAVVSVSQDAVQDAAQRQE